MPDPAQNLTFLSWVREGISRLAAAPSGGRVQAAASITLTARGPDGAISGSETRTLPFLLAGPADVAGLAPGAIVRRYPAPGTTDHESDRCPYVELADPSFPWRYTPAPTPAQSSAGLHPWLVLIVGEETAELTLADGRVTIDVGAQGGEQMIGLPSAPYRFAHVQADAHGHRTSRILCGRRLKAGTNYLAVVVPAYDEAGTPSWTGAATVTIPAYDFWRFSTAVPAGSFEDLAARLRPGDAPAATGRASLRYPRLDEAPTLGLLGALVATSSEGPAEEGPLPAAVEEDLAALLLPARDAEGRPIVALPRYGEAWQADASSASDWGRSLNRDPRHRGVAGLGLEVGIRAQEDLVADVLAHLGALQEARQRIRHAVMGVAVSRSLWQRRVPAAPSERLWLLGPSLARLATEAGTVVDRATSDDRAIPRGTFSAAARRVLRSGPARSPGAASRPAPAALLAAANRPPPATPSTIDGLPLDEAALADFDRSRRETIAIGRVASEGMLAAANDLVGKSHVRLRSAAFQLATVIHRAMLEGRAVPWGEALTLLTDSDAEIVGGRPDFEALVRLVRTNLAALRDRFDQSADDADLVGLLADLDPHSPNDPVVRPVDIGALSSQVASAFTPMTDRPPVLVRVLETITGGIDPAQPLAPPEICVGLGRPAWADLKRGLDEWLLPGVGQLPANCVISLESNPRFIDAFLTGLNSQLLTELRWRNIPIATGCTPIRRFWDRVDTATGARVDDILGLTSWGAQSPLGDATHRPSGASGRELVIAVRGDLFLRYPATLVYLRSARHGSPGTTDFGVDPDEAAVRTLPAFQGRIADDVAFFGFPGLDAAAIVDHWLVFEEPPAAYRFANDLPTDAATGHGWAAATLAQPVRVLIRGDALIAGGA